MEKKGMSGEELEMENEIIEDLKQKFPSIIDAKVQRKRRLWATVKREDLLKVCEYLKDQGFDHLSSISGVDYIKRFETVYHLWSYSKLKLISLKVPIPKDDPKVDSVTSIWESANWHERETYDMFGIIFEGHPNLTRIYLEEDFEGYPFRKDFELEEKPWYEGAEQVEKKEE